MNHKQRRNLFQKGIAAIGRTIAPVLFDPKRRGQFSFRDPIDPGVAELIDKANIFTSEVLARVAMEGVEIAKGVQDLHDNFTDILGTVATKDQSVAVNQAQEILDLPAFAFMEAWIKTLEIVIQSNETIVKKLKKKRRR